MTRRTALLASAGVAATTVLTVSGLGSAEADSRSRPHRGRGRLADLTYTLGEDFPPYALGEEAVRSPATTIEANGYYMSAGTSSSTSAPTSMHPRISIRMVATPMSSPPANS